MNIVVIAIYIMLENEQGSFLGQNSTDLFDGQARRFRRESRSCQSGKRRLAPCPVGDERGEGKIEIG